MYAILPRKCEMGLKGLSRIQWHFLHYMLTKEKVNFIAFNALKWQPTKIIYQKKCKKTCNLSQIARLQHNRVNTPLL